MALKKRKMMFIPDVNPKSFVFFFERGAGGTSWSIRDYSESNRVREYGPQHFRWTVDEVHQRAHNSLDAPSHSTGDLSFWHEHTNECNNRHLEKAKTALELTPPFIPAARSFESSNLAAKSAFPVLNLQQLMDLPKSRKAQDMQRILHSQNSEDWVTWNFFQVLLTQYPRDWWSHIVRIASRKNASLTLDFDAQALPNPRFWSTVRTPPEYETQSRIRMLASGNTDLESRARKPSPVEGDSEIDIVFDHDKFVVFIEAKLGSDISMSTTYDPQRNQIIRNIDCLIASAGSRTPMFWLLVRDEEPSRAYVQLIKSYKADPGLLIRDLPHRNPRTLNNIAQTLTILRWSDFKELICGSGIDRETAAVKSELEHRIVGFPAN